MSWLVALKKFKLVCTLAVLSCCVLVFSGCGRTVSDYTGIWMGIDESGNNYSVYQCDIAASANGQDVTIRMTQYRYELTNNNKLAVWKATAPHFFNGYLDRDGNLVSDVGVIKAKPSSFQLVYGDIIMTRKAKNTEVKLKYVARDKLSSMFPELMFND